MREGMANVIFKSAAHRDFFERYLSQCRYQDAYHAALILSLIHISYILKMLNNKSALNHKSGIQA